MTTLVYPGPETGVRLSPSGLDCPAGVPVDVPDDLAVSLAAQGWIAPPRPPAKPAKDKE